MDVFGRSLVLRSRDWRHRAHSALKLGRIAGWAEAARKIAEAGDDALVMGEFGNLADAGIGLVNATATARLATPEQRGW